MWAHALPAPWAGGTAMAGRGETGRDSVPSVPAMATLEGRSGRSAWGRRLISHLYGSHYSSPPVIGISGRSAGLQRARRRANELRQGPAAFSWPRPAQRSGGAPGGHQLRRCWSRYVGGA